MRAIIRRQPPRRRSPAPPSPPPPALLPFAPSPSTTSAVGERPRAEREVMEPGPDATRHAAFAAITPPPQLEPGAKRSLRNVSQSVGCGQANPLLGLCDE